LQIGSQDPVATASGSTGGQAGIIFPWVAVITFFLALTIAIATASWSAIHAAVIRIIVAVITAFTGASDSVTAASLSAVAETGVGIVTITVIASLIARIILR